MRNTPVVAMADALPRKQALERGGQRRRELDDSFAPVEVRERLVRAGFPEPSTQEPTPSLDLGRNGKTVVTLIASLVGFSEPPSWRVMTMRTSQGSLIIQRGPRFEAFS